MPSKYGYRGYGAARTPGSQDRGLQDEKLSAGKIYSAKTGKLMNKGGGYDSGTPGMFRDIASKGGFRPIPTTPKGGPKVIGPDDPRYGRAKKYFEAQDRKKKALQTTKAVLKTLSSVASPAAAAGSAAYKLAKKMKDKDRLTDRDIDKAKSLVGRSGSKNRPVIKDHSSRNPNPKTPKMMGGGMIAPSQRPGYSKGTMIKARGCKLGRTRPTKIT